MPLLFFEDAYLLQALGWAICNSIWQSGSLWLLYLLMNALDKKLPSAIKYYFSAVLLITSFTWFIFSLVHNYLIISNKGISPEIFNDKGWVIGLQAFLNAAPLLSIAYLLLLCFHSIRFLKNLSANRFMQTKGLMKAPVDFRLFASHTALRLGIKKKIRVWLSGHVDVPSVTGFIKPVILLPAAILSHLSIQQVESILLHELAHIKRNDYLANILQSVVELILFFNPFAMLLSNTAKKERENCCDDWVVNFQYDRFEYAKALLILEEQRHLPQIGFAMAATNSQHNLLQRVKRLFDARRQTNTSILQKIKLTGACLLILVVIFTLLPYMVAKPGVDKAGVFSEKVNTSAVTFNKVRLKSPSSKSIFTSQPVTSTNEKRPPQKNGGIKNRPGKESPGYYVSTFINEEPLHPAMQIEPIITQVVDKKINNARLLVKIEEQQSGKKQTITYYFEMKNTDGNTSIKPLMMVNKFKSPHKNSAGPLPDSLNTTTKPRYKKRITS